MVKKMKTQHGMGGVLVCVSYLESPLTWRVRISPCAVGLCAGSADMEQCMYGTGMWHCSLDHCNEQW